MVVAVHGVELVSYQGSVGLGCEERAPKYERIGIVKAPKETANRILFCRRLAHQKVSRRTLFGCCAHDDVDEDMQAVSRGPRFLPKI